MSNEQENPLVSVIIPTFKRPDMLGRAIDSVLNQTYDNIEIIVIDDNDQNSKYRKETEDFIEKYNNINKFIYLKHKKNQNGAAARNTGIRKANGDFIAFLDDDDEWFPKKIELQIKKLMNSKNEYGAIYCNYSYYTNNKLEYKNTDDLEGKLSKQLLLGEIAFAAGSTLLIRTNILRDELNGFDPQFSRHQDWELMIRFFKNYKILSLNKDLVKLHRDSIINRPNPDDLYLVKKKFLNKFKNVINKFDRETQNDIYKLHYFDVLKLYFNNKKYRKGVNLLEELKGEFEINYRDYFILLINIIDGYVPIKKIFRKFYV